MELNGIMRLNRITRLQCWKKMFNSFLQWSTVAALKLQFAFTGFIYMQYNAKTPQIDLRWSEKGDYYKNFYVKDIIFTKVFKPSSQLFSLCQYGCFVCHLLTLTLFCLLSVHGGKGIRCTANEDTPPEKRTCQLCYVKPACPPEQPAAAQMSVWSNCHQPKITRDSEQC